MNTNEDKPVKKVYTGKKQVINLLYSESEIENIKTFLQMWIDRGKPKSYEIYVGTFCMVERTEDLEEFDMYKLLLRPTSKVVRIKIFPKRNDRNNFEYALNIPMPTREAPLNGVPGNNDPFEMADHRYAEKLREEENLMYKELYEEAKGKMQQIAESKPEPEKADSANWGMALTVVKSLLKNNPNLLKEMKIPGAETLTGVVMDMLDGDGQPKDEQVKSKVTFEPVEQQKEPAEKTPETNQADNTGTTEANKSPDETRKTEPEKVEAKIIQEPQNTIEENPEETGPPAPEQLPEEFMADVVVMEELKSAFHTSEERSKAMLLVRMLKNHPDLVMALLGDLINAKANVNAAPGDQTDPGAEQEEGVPFPVSHAPPEQGTDSQTGQSADVFFIEDLNL